MSETIQKLQPNRDLVCYFQQPSAVAALSSTSSNGFNVSGSWRQQSDWAVIEWNRDNCFEHPLFRNFPDGDLSGLTLTYQETRTTCIPMDSQLYPTVDWPYLRIWLDSPTGDVFHRVKLANYAAPVGGAYAAASATFVLTGAITPGDLIELAWDPFDAEHYNYLTVDGDTLASAVANLTSAINAFSTTVSAVQTGASVTLTLKNSGNGTNANRIGLYGSVWGAQSEVWQPQAQQFNGGVSPTVWQVTIPFASLVDTDTGQTFAANPVRKMRWTYAADLQPGDFVRSEFQVVVTNWSVSGAAMVYNVAGPGSRRIEDDSATVIYTGTWSDAAQNLGNFSGGSISYTTVPNSGLAVSYTEQGVHQLWLGTRKAPSCGMVQVVVDSGPTQTFLLTLSDDELVRLSLGTLAAGSHSVAITNTGSTGSYFYFDFLEIAYPAQTLPDISPNPQMTLATDWDTNHSISLAPERTAWLISKLGFTGRANHYQGALWFFELTRVGQIYASATVTFGGQSEISVQTTITIAGSAMTHLHLTGDTVVTVATAFALQINNGSTGVWAQAVGDVLTITSRAMGTAGNGMTLSVSVVQSGLSSFAALPSGTGLEGGVDGMASGVPFQDSAANVGWRTDLAASPLLNRAARDWSASFFTALAGYGIQATAAFSTELQFVDPSVTAGMAQRYYNGSPVSLNTPAIQTNFSPTSLAFWQEIHLEMAKLMTAAGQPPYLQFGEVQWWYFADSEPSLPFYDAYSEQQFQAAYGRALSLIGDSTLPPSAYPQEAVFLPNLIGQFTSAIQAHVLASVPQTKFEVLYPPDVNNTPFMGAVNLPASSWTPQTLACFKTENFTYTGNRNLDEALESVNRPATLGFTPAQASHLVGIGDYTTPWTKEVGLAMGQNVESVVLFALDQFCLIGYPPDFYKNIKRSISMP